MDDYNEYEFGVPDEILPWLDKLAEDNLHGGLRHYILVDGKIKTASLLDWAEWLEQPGSNRIDLTQVGLAEVSTVFLGLDHSFIFNEMKEGHRPILFETMVFGGRLNQLLWRYSSTGEAKRGHYEIVTALREGRDPDLDVVVEGF